MGSRFDYDAWERTVNEGMAQRQREAEEKASADAERRAEWKRRNDAAIAAEDERRAAKRREIQAKMDAKAQAEAAAVRRWVEAELRATGAAEDDIEREADRVMADWRAEKAQEAAELGDRTKRELATYFARRGSPAWVPGEP